MLFHEPNGTMPSVAEVPTSAVADRSHRPVAAGDHHVAPLGRRSGRQLPRIVVLGQHVQIGLQTAASQLVEHGRRLGPLDR